MMGINNVHINESMETIALREHAYSVEIRNTLIWAIAIHELGITYPSQLERSPMRERYEERRAQLAELTTEELNELHVAQILSMR